MKISIQINNRKNMRYKVILNLYFPISFQMIKIAYVWQISSMRRLLAIFN